ncbi:MAG TPA: RnfABCDGE type electron transport complex subunit D [Candidatus Merdivicinus intestinigallinarum]|nr:RnfABCDGE type electron transport complex subunit D [Candidatus Merdivicinus intestinigallinarum]
MSQLIVSPSPHIRSERTARNIMLDVIIALCPAVIASVILFGWRAFLIEAVCVASCVLIEYLCRVLMKREQTIGDLSAVVTGLLLALNLPVTIPMWVAVFGCFIAIAVTKQLFGGIGQNFANPAIAARVILLASFGGYMTNFTAPFDYSGVDAVASATPLALLAGGADAVTSASSAAGGAQLPSLMQMFLGVKAGCIGEVSALALLIGGVYLVARRVIKPITPLVFIGTVFVFSGILGADPVYQILSGGLMIGAIFMATDYATTPTTNWGKVVFGLGAGLLTVLIRQYGNYPEGVSFAILLMNILTPQIDKLLTRKPLGGKKVEKHA